MIPVTVVEKVMESESNFASGVGCGHFIGEPERGTPFLSRVIAGWKIRADETLMTQIKMRGILGEY